MLVLFYEWTFFKNRIFFYFYLSFSIDIMWSGSVIKSLLRESNPWPFAYEANALPTELNRHAINHHLYFLNCDCHLLLNLCQLEHSKTR